MHIFFRENVGETVIYQWVEKIRETLQSIKAKEKEVKKTNNNVPGDEILDLAQVTNV